MSVITCYVYLSLMAHANKVTTQVPRSDNAVLATGRSALSYVDSSLTAVNICSLLSPDLLYDALHLLSLREA